MMKYLLVGMILCAGIVCGEERLEEISWREKFLQEFSQKLEQEEVGTQDWRQFQQFQKTASTEKEQKTFFLLEAKFQRKIVGNPAAGVELLLPFFLEKNDVESWKQKNQQKGKEKKTPASQTNSTENPSSEEPSIRTIHQKVPALYRWNFQPENASLAVEIANSLLEEGYFEDVLAIVAEVGKNNTDDSAVMAAETGGDLYARMKIWDKSVELYDYGGKLLQMLSRKKYEPGEGEQTVLTEEQKRWQQRLEKKRREAQKELEADRYGADWVAYKEAQENHFSKDYLAAFLKYEKIRHAYPDSIYAEAAVCYQIEILTSLSDPANQPALTSTLESEQKKLSQLLQAKQTRNAALLEKYLQQEKTQASLVKQYQSLPRGLKALEEAEKKAEAWIAEEEKGLYRGEVMLTIGTCWLEVFHDLTRAEKWYERAADWFARVQRLETRLTRFQVPEKSQKISQPPPVERTRDLWSNLQKSRLRPGELFNRRECSWYLGFLQKRTLTMLGLIAYSRQDYDKAEKVWRSLYKLDSWFQEEDQSEGLTWSYVKRLLWNIQHNRGALFGDKEEVRSFNDPQSRLMLLIADLELEMENYPEAEEKFRRLLKNKKIQSNRNQAAYCTRALATALMMQGPSRNKEMFALFKLFNTGNIFSKTDTTPYALWLYANQLSQCENTLPQTLALYERIFTEYPKHTLAEEAYLTWAEKHTQISSEKGLEMLRKYLKKYPNSDLNEHAHLLIDSILHPEKYNGEEENEEVEE
ncbi:MAG: hypothetical protein Q4D62_12355 [Planctomycetia bacterium]|nr:hypothetical protein [Planctomycetia bacterium]